MWIILLRRLCVASLACVCVTRTSYPQTTECQPQQDKDCAGRNTLMHAHTHTHTHIHTHNHTHTHTHTHQHTHTHTHTHTQTHTHTHTCTKGCLIPIYNEAF